MRFRAAQVDIAKTEARFFGGGDFVFDRKRRCLGVVQDVEFGGDDFDLAGADFRIGLLASDDFPFDGDDEFAAGLLGLGVRLGLGFFVKDHLDDSAAVADVEEQQIAEVATFGDPAEHDSIVVRVLGAEMAAVVCAFQIAEKVEHGRWSPNSNSSENSGWLLLSHCAIAQA